MPPLVFCDTHTKSFPLQIQFCCPLHCLVSSTLWFPQLSKLASFLVHQLFGPPKLTPCAFILRTGGVYQINHKEATKKYPKSVTPPFSKFRDPKSKCHYGPPKSTIFIRIPRPPPPKQSRGVLKLTISRQYFWNHGMYFYQWLHGRHQFRFPA